jgi:hypothetical protein
MFMKTHTEDFADSGLAIMLMKTQQLISFCHYIIENKGSCGKACFHSMGLRRKSTRTNLLFSPGGALDSGAAPYCGKCRSSGFIPRHLHTATIVVMAA